MTDLSKLIQRWLENIDICDHLSDIIFSWSLKTDFPDNEATAKTSTLIKRRNIKAENLKVTLALFRHQQQTRNKIDFSKCKPLTHSQHYKANVMYTGLLG